MMFYGFEEDRGLKLGYDNSWDNLSVKVAELHTKEKEQFQKLKSTSAREIEKNLDIRTNPKVVAAIQLERLKKIEKESQKLQKQKEIKEKNSTIDRNVICEIVSVEQVKENNQKNGLAVENTQKPTIGLTKTNSNSGSERSGSPASSNGRKSPGENFPTCLRCDKTAYPKEAVEPHKGAVFHEWCFKCRDCGLKLNLRNFAKNPKDPRDSEVYCKAHAPQLDAAKVDHTSKAILDCTHAPRLTTVNNQIRGPDAGKGAKYDSGALCIQSALNVPRPSERIQHIAAPPDVTKSDKIGLRYI